MSGDLLVLGRPSDCDAEGPIAGSGMVEPSAVTERAGGDRVMSEAATVGRVEPGSITWSSRFADYVELTKPRIVTMILVVTALSAVFAAGRALEGAMMLHLLLGTAVVAASAGVLNQVMERRVDGLMARTRRRPLPQQRVSVWGAVVFALALIVGGTCYLGWAVGWTPAWLGVATWALYVVVYTPLKTRTSFNTTIGAIAGALPMQMGYTAAGGELADVEGWLLFAVLLLWQYPHFMAIAWMYRRDYGAAGLRMSPVVEPTGRSAGRQAVVGTVALMIVLVALARPWTAAGFDLWGVVFAVAAVAVTAKFVMASWRFAREPNDLTARGLLRASLAQLPAAMLVLVLSALI